MKTATTLKTIIPASPVFSASVNNGNTTINIVSPDGTVANTLCNLVRSGIASMTAAQATTATIIRTIADQYPSQSLKPADYKEALYKALVSGGMVPADKTKADLHKCYLAEKAAIKAGETASDFAWYGERLLAVYMRADYLAKLANPKTEEAGPVVDTTETDNQPEAETAESFDIAALSPAELLNALSRHADTLSAANEKKARKAIQQLHELFAA